MANQLQAAGAALAPSDYAPLHVNRQATGMWPNTNPMRDASTSGYVEANYGGKKDSYSGGTNCEVSTRLTLIRRPGLSIYNSQIFPPISRFYGWNTFTLTTEAVRMMADTAATVYDATGPNTKNAVFTKSPGAGTTYFLGVGNTLYFTNGVDNKQLNNGTGVVTNWGVPTPITAPTATQQPRPNNYPGWAANTAYACYVPFIPVGGGAPDQWYNVVAILDSNGDVQRWGRYNGLGPVMSGQLGSAEPTWSIGVGNETVDGTIRWTGQGDCLWTPQAGRGFGQLVVKSIAAQPGLPLQLFVTINSGNTNGAPEPVWPGVLGQQVSEGEVIWQNIGRILRWADIGTTTSTSGLGNYITTGSNIIDVNGFLETVYLMGLSQPAAPTVWANQKGAQTADGPTLIWQNTGPFAIPGQAPIQYGYAYATTDAKGNFIDIGNMSPKSNPITVIQGNEVVVQGDSSPDPSNTVVIVYRTAQGGSTFLYDGQVPMPAGGAKWTFIDNNTDQQLNTEIQAQVGGEGTPLPAGATCLAYHLGRIFAAVGNVVYVSSGPDAIASGSSGNAGFDTTFTAQSQIIRFWVMSLGVVVYTLRDAYLVQGSGTPSDPLYMSTWLEDIPLLHYDAFTVLLSTAYLFGGQRMVQSLDAGSGITESSFPLAPLAAQIDPRKAYLTMHTGGSGETALYLADGETLWYRMAPTSAPESGLNWSPAAVITGGMSAIQSTEILPGIKALLVGPSAATGPIRVRDVNTRLDAGIPYPMGVDYNPIVLANPGQLAGLAWMSLKCSAAGNAPTLGVLLDEIDGDYEAVPRTRQDPTNLPPSSTYLSNRHSLLQNQKPVWCQVIKYGLQWAAEDSPDELLTSTIFGQTWQEQRSQ